MSWDDDDYEVKLPPVAAAPSSAIPAAAVDVEDVDATVTESTAAPKAPVSAAPAAPEVLKDKHKKKEVERAKEAREAAQREVAKQRLEEEGGPLDDPAAEKKRLEALQERADLELARESLGGSTRPAAPLALDTKSLVAAISLPDADAFKVLATEIAGKVSTATGRTSTHALNFYRELLRAGADKLTVDDLATLGQVLEVQKSKRAKPAKTAKKSGGGGGRGGGGALYVERADDYTYASGRDYDDYADVDAPAAAAPATAAAGAGGDAAPSAAAAAPAAAVAAAPAAWNANLDGDFM